MNNKRRLPSFLLFSLIFKNFIFNFALILTLFGLLMSNLMIDYSIFQMPVSYDAHTTGTISGTTSTQTITNDQRVYKVEYTYLQLYHGVSYVNGNIFRVNGQATVDYASDYPLESNINGGRKKEGGFYSLLVLIFPLIGVVLCMNVMVKSLFISRVLKVGFLVDGNLLDVEDSNVRINNKKVFNGRYSFIARNGNEYETLSKSTSRNRFAQTTPIIYDPKNPKRSVVIDTLPIGLVVSNNEVTRL